RGGAPRLRVPRGRLPIGLRGGRRDRGVERVHRAGGPGGVRSHLLEGKVRHRRSNPFVYELEHDVFYLALDTSELDRIGRMKLLGRNRWRPFTFRDDDHWKPAATDI